MRRFAQGILHPESYHGEGVRPPFFEGWYLKLVTADGKRSLALIPGIFRGTERGSAHTFIQVVDPDRPWVAYERFPADALRGRSDAFEVEIGPHRFGAQGLKIDLPACRGELRFGPLAPWPVTPRSPGVMGWYAWVPGMQCYHGVVSLDHALEGTLEVNGAKLDFDGGRGYIEKDWGKSFPRRWVWMQSNHFEEEGVCVTASLAHVPWVTGSFPGFLVGFWRRGELTRFTTYTGAELTSVEALENGVRLEVASPERVLTLTARGGHPVDIHMPSEGSMRGVVKERLDATLEVRLAERGRGGSALFEGVGFQAAYEAQGDVSELRGRSSARAASSGAQP